jgi:hypothetical protein
MGDEHDARPRMPDLQELLATARKKGLLRG